MAIAGCGGDDPNSDAMKTATNTDRGSSNDAVCVDATGPNSKLIDIARAQLEFPGRPKTGAERISDSELNIKNIFTRVPEGGDATFSALVCSLVVDTEATSQFGVTAESIRETPNYVRQIGRGICSGIEQSGQSASAYIEAEIAASKAALDGPRPSGAPAVTDDDVERQRQVMQAAANSVCPDL
jgi:hypothetical protein